MIIEHTTIKFHSRTQHVEQQGDRKQSKGFEGKKIINQVAYNSVTQKHTKSKNQTPLSYERPDSDTFRQLLSRRDRNKENDSKMEHRFKKVDDNKSEKNLNHHKSYSKSKSKSRSKGLVKSKSLKQLGKKSKSMLRLQVKQRKQHHMEKTTKQERKSYSPQKHVKSTMSIIEKKNVSLHGTQYKSNYVSKTNREYTSELTTDRQKSKGKLKASQISKPSKREEKNKDFKKKSAPKIVNQKKKKIEKQSSKTEKKLKPILKPKAEKKVIISQESSKLRRNEQQWNSSQNQDQFLDPKEKKDLKEKDKKIKHKESNIVEVPKRKQRLSLNTNSKRCLKAKNTKTETIQVQKQRQKDLEEWAAVTIQKVFRGYLTRKYIRECFEHNAAINIQRVWRGYRVRCQVSKQFNQEINKILQQSAIQKSSTEGPKHRKILQHQQYLLQKSSSRESSLRNSNLYAEKWASILQEILSEQSVNSDIKKKIEVFLQRQRKEMNEFDYHSNRSSAKSNISSQVINNEINSEKHFMENFIQQEKKKKQHPNMNVFISPTNYKSPNRFGYNSPQTFLMNSPTYHIPERLDESRELNSSQMLIQNLKNIQRFHKQRLQSKANDEKQELNKMLIKNTLTPRTHEKKYKQVDQVLQSELEKFNESINEIVKNCILYKESPSASNEASKSKTKKSYDQFMEFNEESMITPKKELIQLQIPFEMPEECIHSQKLAQHDGGVLANLKKLQQKSQQFYQYYKFQKEQLRKQQSDQSFDSSYQFIEEYLINLIDFIRQYQGGSYVLRVLGFLRKPRSHQVQTIINNMSAVSEGSEHDQDLDSSFKLPLYKYLELDQQIIDGELVEAFNLTFTKLRRGNELQECFMKMLVECMNEALNSLRPTLYIFSQTQLSTLNTLKNMEKVPVFQSENTSEEEMQYQFMLAQTLNKIFYWNKLEWGKAINLKPEEQGDRYQEMKELLLKQQDCSISQLVSKEEWNFYEEMVEIISLLTQQLFVNIVYEQAIEIAWNTNLSPKRIIGKQAMDLVVPNTREFFQA